MAKFFISLLLLIAALALQFFAVPLGYPFDFAFAVLIALAFILDLVEFLPLIALAVLVLNWQPALSAPILVCALFPLIVHGLRQIFHWEPWIAVPAAAAVGVVALGIVPPSIGIGTIALDAVAAAGLGALSFWIVMKA